MNNDADPRTTVKTGKRLKAAKKRDAAYLKAVAKLATTFKGEGIWDLMYSPKRRALELLPAAAKGIRKPPQSIHCGSVEKLAFRRSDARHPAHLDHARIYHGIDPCNCRGHGHPRKALKSERYVLISQREAA